MTSRNHTTINFYAHQSINKQLIFRDFPEKVRRNDRLEVGKLSFRRVKRTDLEETPSENLFDSHFKAIHQA